MYCIYMIEVGFNRTKLTGIHMQWETATGICMNIGKQLITHLVSKGASSGIGLIRFTIFLFYNQIILNI